MQQAVINGDASGLEDVAGRSGSAGATAVCYLHPGYAGQQPGGCPTMYFRDASRTRSTSHPRSPTPLTSPPAPPTATIAGTFATAAR